MSICDELQPEHRITAAAHELYPRVTAYFIRKNPPRLRGHQAELITRIPRDHEAAAVASCQKRTTASIFRIRTPSVWGNASPGGSPTPECQPKRARRAQKLGERPDNIVALRGAVSQ